MNSVKFYNSQVDFTFKTFSVSFPCPFELVILLHWHKFSLTNENLSLCQTIPWWRIGFILWGFAWINT